jgi:hypothetical protein
MFKLLCVYVIILLSLSVISRTDHRNPLRQRVKLVAVAHFDGIETYYKSLFDGNIYHNIPYCGMKRLLHTHI